MNNRMLDYRVLKKMRDFITGLYFCHMFLPGFTQIFHLWGCKFSLHECLDLAYVMQFFRIVSGEQENSAEGIEKSWNKTENKITQIHKIFSFFKTSNSKLKTRKVQTKRIVALYLAICSPYLLYLHTSISNIPDWGKPIYHVGSYWNLHLEG